MRTVISLLKRKRIWIFNIILPLLFGFFLLNMIGKSISVSMNDTGNKIHLGLVNLDAENDLSKKIEQRQDIKIADGITAANIEQKIKDKEIELGIIIPKGFGDKINRLEMAEVKLFHRGNDLDVEDVISSISDFEENIIAERMDSMNLSDSYVNPITIKEKNISNINIIEIIDNNIRNYLPVILFLFAFLGLTLPAGLSLHNLPKDSSLLKIPIWDKLLGVSFFGLLTTLILILSFWLSIQFFDEHPAFLKGLIKKYLSIYNVFNLSWILFLSNIFWTCIISFMDRKTERRLGRFGIYFFTLTMFFIALITVSGLSYLFNLKISAATSFTPLLNSFTGIKEFLSINGISFPSMLLLLTGLLFWASIGFFILKFSSSSNKNDY